MTRNIIGTLLKNVFTKPIYQKQLVGFCLGGAVVGAGISLMSKSFSHTPDAKRMLAFFPYLEQDQIVLDGCLTLFHFASFNSKEHQMYALEIAHTLNELLEGSYKTQAKALDTPTSFEMHILSEKTNNLFNIFNISSWSPISIHSKLNESLTELRQAVEDIDFNMRQESVIRLQDQ